MSTKLHNRATAPTIQAVDIWGKKVAVPAKQRWVYLSFHRFADCPFCNLRMNELISNHDRLREQHIEVVSVWPSAKEKLLHHSNGASTPFSVLSNEEKNFYVAYGVTSSSFLGAVRLFLHPQLVFKALKNKHKNIAIDADPQLMPASFLINKEGIVNMAYYGKHFGDHPSIESIIAAKN